MDALALYFRRKRWLVLVDVLLLLAAALIESGGDLLGMGECENIPLAVRFTHQRLCTSGYFKPRVHFTRLVTLSKKIEPIEDKCEGREFMASLLLRLREMGPSVVVIDKWYPSNVCKETAGTGALKNAILQLSKSIPVVLGEGSDTLDELRANADPRLNNLLQNGFTDRDQLADEPSLVPVDGKEVLSGLVRLNCDTRRIPLRWNAYPNEGSVRHKDKVSLPSLSLAAALAMDEDVGEYLKGFLDRGEHPLTSFLSDDRFKPIYAMQIVCGDSIPASAGWRSCSTPTNHGLDLRNKVVIIGEYSSDDEHRTVLGNVPGVLIQANYIEALLGDRYFKRLGVVSEALSTIASFVIIAFIFEISGPHWGLVKACIFVFCLWMISYLTVIQWGYVLTFWVVSAVAIVPKYVDALTERIRERRGNQHAQH